MRGMSGETVSAGSEDGLAHRGPGPARGHGTRGAASPSRGGFSDVRATAHWTVQAFPFQVAACGLALRRAWEGSWRPRDKHVQTLAGGQPTGRGLHTLPGLTAGEGLAQGRETLSVLAKSWRRHRGNWAVAKRPRAGGWSAGVAGAVRARYSLSPGGACTGGEQGRG